MRAVGVERAICTKRMNAKSKAILRQSVAQIVENNKEVFDKLAKR